MANAAASEDRISGPSYRLTPDEIASFHKNGYVTLRAVIVPAELAELERVFDEFNDGKRGVDFGRDLGDHSQGHGTNRLDYNMINVNIPCTHDPRWANNIFEQRAASITEQLHGRGMAKDYEQLLTKIPNRPKAIFPFHQDMAYWPKKSGLETRTATISLAINQAAVENGCLEVLPESQLTKSLYGEHENYGANTDDKGDIRAIRLKMTAEDEQKVIPLPVGPGDCTVHDEWIVHGSSGNKSEEPRKTYVVAFRDEKMIAYERKHGFNHSYNDAPEVLKNIRGGLI
ncbi:MAG: phytanoyl-CoA hydroxylase [Mariniblastus sp.]|jgi:phytanoyl-CoA hydroxylase